MIEGLYFDGQSSNQTATTLYVTDEGRIGLEHVDKAAIAFNMLSISSRTGNTARYITFPNGGQFETLDNDAIDNMVKQLSSSKFQGVLHTLESSKRLVLTSLILVVAIGWGMIQYGIPHFSQQVATLLPEQASQYLGQGVLDTMDKHWFKKSTLPPARQHALTTQFNDLLTTLNKKNIQIQFRQSETIGANAFALPNNIIVFTDELIMLSNNDDEIVSIMLHELGHLEHKHSLRATTQQFSLAILIMIITGDVSASSSLVTSIPLMLVESGYSQAMETQADTYALNFMIKNNINPRHFSRIMEKLEASHSNAFKQCQEADDAQIQNCIDSAVQHVQDTHKEHDNERNVSRYFSTHPVTQARMARFNSAAF